MEKDKAYRQEGLASTRCHRIDVPEYRLRRLINQQLGHRNFSAFVNGYRLAEAEAALSDPAQADVPILTIALDAGFGSIGPFNRAFKAHTGLTPSDIGAPGSNPATRAVPIPEIGRPFPEFGQSSAGNRRDAEFRMCDLFAGRGPRRFAMTTDSPFCNSPFPP